MIREAVEADRFAILRLGRTFVEALGLLPFDAAHAERTVKDYIASPDKLCLVYAPGKIAQGFLMAHAGQHPFWPVKAATELAWWVDPAHRGIGALGMLAAYEEWAREQGCSLAGMVHLGDDRLARLYGRRGYRATETHFLKAL